MARRGMGDLFSMHRLTETEFGQRQGRERAMAFNSQRVLIVRQKKVGGADEDILSCRPNINISILTFSVPTLTSIHLMVMFSVCRLCLSAVL